MSKIKKIGELTTDDGEAITFYYAVEAPTMEAARLIFGEEYPLVSEHCHHSHDCCGNFYRDTPEFIPRSYSNEWIVVQSAHINI